MIKLGGNKLTKLNKKIKKTSIGISNYYFYNYYDDDYEDDYQ